MKFVVSCEVNDKLFIYSSFFISTFVTPMFLNTSYECIFYFFVSQLMGGPNGSSVDGLKINILKNGLKLLQVLMKCCSTNFNRSIACKRHLNIIIIVIIFVVEFVITIITIVVVVIIILIIIIIIIISSLLSHH